MRGRGSSAASPRSGMHNRHYDGVADERERVRGRVSRADARAAEGTAGTSGSEQQPAATVPSVAPALVARAQAGDAAAREQLIEALLPLVASFARRYRTDGLEPADLIQEGVVGLLRALQRYDAAQGVPFAAFASWWIRQSLQESRSDFLRPLRLPPKALRQLASLKSEHQRIYQAEHRSAGIDELAGSVGIGVEQARSLLAADARPRSLDDPLEGDDGELGTLGDLLVDPLSAAAYEDVLDAIAGAELRAQLGRLTEREREIVRARFGFDGEAQRLVDVARDLGISAERVRQIEERALAKVRLGA